MPVAAITARLEPTNNCARPNGRDLFERAFGKTAIYPGRLIRLTITLSRYAVEVQFGPAGKTPAVPAHVPLAVREAIRRRHPIRPPFAELDATSGRWRTGEV